MDNSKSNSSDVQKLKKLSESLAQLRDALVEQSWLLRDLQAIAAEATSKEDFSSAKEFIKKALEK